MIPIAKPLIDENEKSRVMEVLDSGMITLGETVREFEKAFANYTGADYSIATSSGTSALHVAMAAAGIGPGDRVLTTPFSFIATANTILYCGGTPVFCDVNGDDFNLNPRSIRKALDEYDNVKAVLIVHIFGQPCDMDEIMEIVDEYGLVLIEDCAQAHGARYKDKHVGTFGLAGTFSFYPTKNMTTAEGGMVITQSEEFFKRLKRIREHGMSKAGAYDYTMLGYNYRMTNIEAAIGLAQLEKLDGFNRKRAENARYYDKNLSDIDWLSIPVVRENRVHCYHQYTLKVQQRDAFAEHLAQNGVGYKVFYPALIPDTHIYRKMGYDGSRYPIARSLTREVISIPVHPGVTVEDREKIVEVIRNFKPLPGEK